MLRKKVYGYAWRKCRDPKEWICDKCSVCGGCKTCPDQIMYHKGDESLCASCFHKKKKVEEA